MKQFLSLLAPLALGLFIGKNYGAWIAPPPQAPLTSGGRAPASVVVPPTSFLPAVLESLVAEGDTAKSSVSEATAAPEAALALFSQMRASDIKSVCETARELYATKSISAYARYIRDFSNFTEHDEWLRRKAKTMTDEGPAWRGLGSLTVGDSKIELEVLVAPPKPSSKDRLTAEQECFAVQIYASRDGGLRQSESGTHCMSDFAYKDGSYYFTWAGASGSLYHLDISAILIALPKSKSETVTYMTDGRDEWQNAESFSWTPVSVEEQSVRLAQLLNELSLTGQ